VADAQPLVVVLPVYDEAATVAAVIERVPDRVAGHPVEVVVVDDGSTDGSAEEAVAAGAKVVSHDTNRGLGAAVRTGFEVARSMDAVACAFLDADGEYDPSELAQLFEPVRAGTADYVIGTRFGGHIESMLPHRRVGNILLTWLTMAFARRRLSDGQSGFRLLGPDALAVAEIAHDYNYAQVLTLDLLGKGMRYAEVPITYRRRMVGTSFIKLGPYLRAVLPAMVAVRFRRR
jgi:glycosyltransferase involved in cell wall biosynthesis